jgi:TonB-linked SusC/RagA family outer membrane protein
MKKIVSTLVLMTLCFSMAVIAQTRSVTGSVTDSKGGPIPFAAVIIKGTKQGVTTDADGRFVIKAKTGDVLEVVAQGMLKKEVPVTAENIFVISIDRDEKETLAEVVVTTAFEIKKSSRTTPFSAQTISADNLNLIRQPNLNNALAGKVAGVQFRGQSPIALDRDAVLRIRGGSTLNGELGPIYVVDGTIVNSFDINPDDVETLTVLKGANATALFGGRAANGAIVITTRKKNNSKGIGVELNSGITFDRVYILPKYQNSYMGGANPTLTTYHWKTGDPVEWKALEGKGFPDYTDDSSWGPAIQGQEYVPWYAWIPGHSRSFQTALLVAQPNNVRDFWETGITTNNNISLSKSGQGYTYRLSYTKQYVKGLLPTTSSDRNNLNLSVSADINQHFTVSTNITYSAQQINGTFNDGYANQSSGNFNQWFHRDLDMKIMKELRGLKTPIGTYASWNLSSNPDGYDPSNPLNFYGGNYWYNHYTKLDQAPVGQNRQRLFGDASLKYKLNNHFYVKGTFRRNQLTTSAENIFTSGLAASATQTGDLASYSTSYNSYIEDNYELLSGYTQRFGNLDVSATIGGNKLSIREYGLSASTAQGLNVPGLYSISNSKAQPTIGNTRNLSETKSLFATGDLEYKKFVSVTWALRSDWYSTLPSGNNRLVSPSVGAGFVFSEFTKNSISWLNFGKVFGSWGKKPRDLRVYANNFLYSVNANQWAGNFLMTTPDQLIDPNLKGSLITTYEAGIDLRFLKNKLGVNITYYNEDNNGEPVGVSQSGVSGYTSKLINAARIKKEGIEVLVNATPIITKNFTWQLSMNYSYLIKNPVVQLAPGIGTGGQTLLAGGAFGTRFARAFQEVGSDWGQLIGGGIARNANGDMLVNPTTGLFVADATKHWGSVVPKTNGGIVNSFSYKNFTFGFNLDYQVGGQFFSLSEMWGNFSGILAETAAINDNGKNVRNDVGAGGGVHVIAVSSVDQKTPVDKYVDVQSYFQQFYFNKVAEPYIHSLTYVKMREVNLGMNLPVTKWGLSKVLTAANFSIIARNPFLIYRKTTNFDPSEISGLQGEDGQYPGTRSVGFNLKLTF